MPNSSHQYGGGGGANQTGISVLFLSKQEIKVTRKEKISSFAEAID